MKHELKKIENSAVEIKMTLTAEEVAPLKVEAVKSVTEKVEVPGFRKGHAPESAVISNYGDAIKEEIIEKILQTNYNNLIKEEKIVPVSYVYEVKAEMKDGFELTFKVDVYPEVKLGEYKGLEAEKETFEMTEEILNKEIEMLLKAGVTLEDAPEGHAAKIGDTVDLAFEGFVDGVAFDGGKSESHQLKLGSKSFIDTFEDQLVGYVVGQEGEVNVNFPEQYHSNELAGKPAVFKVKINSIKLEKANELNDEFAKNNGFESVADLKEKKNKEIIERENNKNENKFIGDLITKIIETSTIDVPKSMVLKEVENRLAEMNQQLSMQGMNIEQYFKMMGMTMEQAVEQLSPMSLNKIKSDLILEAIAKAENLEVAPEELNARMEEIAKMYGMDIAALEAELNKNSNLDMFKSSVTSEILAKKAIDVLKENAK